LELEIHYRDHKSPPADRNLSLTNQAHIFTFYVFDISFNINIILFAYVFPVVTSYILWLKFRTNFSSRATNVAHRIPLDLITLIISGEERTFKQHVIRLSSTSLFLDLYIFPIISFETYVKQPT